MNVIVFGWVELDLIKLFMESFGWLMSIEEKVLVKRFGRLDEIVGVVVFLVSVVVSFMYGEIVVVDGGLMVKVV